MTPSIRRYKIFGSFCRQTQKSRCFEGMVEMDQNPFRNKSEESDMRNPLGMMTSNMVVKTLIGKHKISTKSFWLIGFVLHERLSTIWPCLMLAESLLFDYLENGVLLKIDNPTYTTNAAHTL